MISNLLAGTTRDDPEQPAVPTDVLVSQGLAAMIFLLSFTVLQGLLWLPLPWRDGEMVRLIGLLWALPTAAVMTTRHARLQLAGMPALTYLQRMRYARLAALLLAVVAFPIALSRLRDGQSEWMTPALAYPILISLFLCLCASVIAGKLSILWFDLPLQSWEGSDRQASWSVDLAHTHSFRIDRSLALARLWRYWLAGALLMTGALTIHQQAPDLVGVPRFWGMLAFLTYVGLGPLLIGQAARAGRHAQWQLDRSIVSAEVLQGWGARGFTLIIIALTGAGLALVSGLFGVLHLQATRLLSLLGLAAPHGPDRLSPGSGNAVPLVEPSYSDGGWTAQSGAQSGHGGWSLALPIPHFPVLCLALAAAGVLVWSVIWARKHESHGVARWLLLAALVDQLAAYLRWFWQGMRGHALIRLWTPNPSKATKRAAHRPQPKASTAIPAAPRQAIIALYLQALERTTRRGYPRRPGQTPLRHAADLHAGLRKDQQAPLEMAELFTTARFSPRPIDGAAADRMHQLRRSILRNLRRRP